MSTAPNTTDGEVDGGARDRPRISLFMLPGMDGTGKLFEPLIRQLPSEWLAISISYPPEAKMRYSDLLGIVLAALPSLGPFFLLAESFSGPLAIRAAARRPPGLQGVILAASFAKSPIPAPRFLTSILPLSPLIRAIPWWLKRFFLLGTHSDSVLEARLRSVIEGIDPVVLSSRIREIGSTDVTADLSRIKVPLLSITAGRDRLVPASSGRLIRRHLPGARLVQIAGPHLILQAKPAHAMAAITDFAANC